MMNNYKLVRLSKPMKECGEYSTMATFTDAKGLYEELTKEYIEKPLTCELVRSGGLYALVALDEKGNYKNIALVLEMLNNKIRGYRNTTPADELKVATFWGVM